MLPVSTCPICNASSWTEHLACLDYTSSRERFTLKKCTTCKLIVTSPRPQDEQLSRYYLSRDYISHTDKASSVIDRLYLFVRSYSLRWKLKLVKKHSEKTPHVLDYGCGTGDFLKTCRQNHLTIAGVELSPIARETARQKTNIPVASNISELSDQKFGAITLWHVLEHIPQLNEVLEKLALSLEDNGTIFIAVPNPNSFDATLYRHHWAGYDVPRHLWHFTQQNMSRLLRNHSLTVKAVVPMKLDSFYVSMLSEKYRSHGKTNPLNLLRAAVNGFLSNIQAKKTGEYSSLIYIAKKNES